MTYKWDDPALAVIPESPEANCLFALFAAFHRGFARLRGTVGGRGSRGEMIALVSEDW